MIAPQFEPLKGTDAMITVGTSRFSEGLAHVMVGGLYGYINKKGDFVIAPQFIRAQELSEGLAWFVTKEGKIGWIDRSGRWIVTLGGGAIFQVSSAYCIGMERWIGDIRKGLRPCLFTPARNTWEDILIKRGRSSFNPETLMRHARFWAGSRELLFMRSRTTRTEDADIQTSRPARS